MNKYMVIYMNTLNDIIIFSSYNDLDTAKHTADSIRKNHSQSIKEVLVYEQIR